MSDETKPDSLLRSNACWQGVAMIVIGLAIFAGHAAGWWPDESTIASTLIATGFAAIGVRTTQATLTGKP